MSTLFLRNEKNQTVLDVEIWIDESKTLDVRSVVCVRPYSKLLIDIMENPLTYHSTLPSQLIEDFDELSELRGWYWERWVEHHRDLSVEEARSQVYEEVKARLRIVAGRYKLHVVED